MRVLVVGAGAIGGYFGGRMLQAGRERKPEGFSGLVARLGPWSAIREAFEHRVWVRVEPHLLG